MEKEKEQILRMKTILYSIDEKNKNCVDCGKESMDYASINMGIVICSECAEKHKSFGYNISFLRKFSERWDDYLLNFMKAGGNTRFLQFCKDYKITNLSIDEKYMCKGAEYYREIILSEILNFDPPDNIEVNDAKIILSKDQIANNYPEFETYNIVKHVDLKKLEEIKPKLNIKKEEEENTGFFGSIGGFFGSVKNKVSETASNLYNKVKDVNIYDVSSSISETAGDIYYKVKDTSITDVKNKIIETGGNIYSKINDINLEDVKNSFVEKSGKAIGAIKNIIGQQNEEDNNNNEIKEENKDEDNINNNNIDNSKNIEKKLELSKGSLNINESENNKKDDIKIDLKEEENKNKENFKEQKIKNEKKDEHKEKKNEEDIKVDNDNKNNEKLSTINEDKKKFKNNELKNNKKIEEANLDDILNETPLDEEKGINKEEKEQLEELMKEQ